MNEVINLETDQNTAKSKRSERVKNNRTKSKNLNAMDDNCYKPPKKWKHVYLRSEKMRRAKQLGFEYPIRSTRQMLDDLEK